MISTSKFEGKQEQKTKSNCFNGSNRRRKKPHVLQNLAVISKILHNLMLA
jgi:hypothetical protein